MQNINAFDHAETILKVLAKGAFLTTAAGGRHNTMTIGWGALGNIWGKPVFTVMVRHSRYTHELPVIKGAGLHLECRIVEKREMAPENFDKALADRWYADKDWHTYYTGEITAAYLDK